MVFVLEGAIGAHQLLQVVLTGRVLAELPHEGASDRGDPLLDGRAWSLA